MTQIEQTVENLSLFNNLSFTKKQWDIILKGCGCPKSTHFWKALRENNLIREGLIYTLVDMDIHSYAVILEQYSALNTKAVMKTYKKKKFLKKVEERNTRIRSTVFYSVNGVLTTEPPTREL